MNDRPYSSNDSFNILQVMGCSSVQYASMEIYLINKAKYLQDRGNKFIVVYENTPRSKRFINEFESFGGKLYRLKLKGVFDFSFYRKIYNIIRNHDIDMVHSYFGPTNHLLAVYLNLRGFRKIVRTGTNLPFVMRERKNWLDFFHKVYLSFRHRMLVWFVRKIICRSEGVKKAFLSLGLPQKKLAVASGGVSTNHYKFSSEARDRLRREFGVKQDALVMGVSCRLVPYKGVDRLIELFKDSGSRMTQNNVMVLIAGDGPELDKLKKQTRTLDLDKRVKFAGHREDISSLYSAFDIFCLPSIIEGMSNSILEAMASELPVIASDISSNHNLITDGMGGYLISFDDEKEFSRIIDRLSSRELRTKMGKYNRDKVMNQYSLNKRIEKEFEVYKNVLS